MLSVNLAYSFPSSQVERKPQGSLSVVPLLGGSPLWWEFRGDEESGGVI